jgi:hypothetical protein
MTPENAIKSLHRESQEKSNNRQEVGLTTPAPLKTPRKIGAAKHF